MYVFGSTPSYTFPLHPVSSPIVNSLYGGGVECSKGKTWGRKLAI